MSTTRAVLQLLADAPRPMGCAWVGDAIRPESTRMRMPNHGGGDYAAQMFLGKLRKRGLVEQVNTGGSSAWQISWAGRKWLASERG